MLEEHKLQEVLTWAIVWSFGMHSVSGEMIYLTIKKNYFHKTIRWPII